MLLRVHFEKFLFKFMLLSAALVTPSIASAQSCPVPTTVTFANLVSTSTSTTGDLYAGAVKVGTFSADVPGTSDAAILRNSGSTLTVKSFSTSIPPLSNGDYKLTITAAAGMTISGGAIEFTGKSPYVDSTFAGYNNFKDFSVGGTNVSQVTVQQDTVSGIDYLPNLSVGSILTLGQIYVAEKPPVAPATTPTYRYFANGVPPLAAPVFILDYTVNAISSGQSATIEFQKQDTGALDGNFSNETHDFISTLTGCVTPPLPSLSVGKASSIFDTGNPLFHLPNNDVLYTLSVANSGIASPTTDSVFLVDPLPSALSFFNGDADGAGSGTTPVLFTDAASGLTFNYATDVAYATGSTPPTSFSACTYTPAAGYDPNVHYICLNPKGTMANTGSTSNPHFTIQFRAKIK